MSGGNYYNEFDPKAAALLRELIKAGLIPAGDVDDRSIEDVRPDDLRGYVQCHFFAGIGGWSHALDLAGWPRDRPVWTGSCPCQPFSAAGKGDGFEDERHLWPAWQHLIAQCHRPRASGRVHPRQRRGDGAAVFRPGGRRMNSTANLDVFDHSDAVKARAARIAADTVLHDPHFSDAERAKRARDYVDQAAMFEQRMKADGVRE